VLASKEDLGRPLYDDEIAHPSFMPSPMSRRRADSFSASLSTKDVDSPHVRRKGGKDRREQILARPNRQVGNP
jgi:hypothetical protein